MGGFTKIMLMIAAICIGLGAVFFVLLMSVNGWDFSKLGGKYQEKTYEITQDFHSISIDTKTADIHFVLSENEQCKVVCFEKEKTLHNVEVENGVLSVALNDQRKWYDYIEISTKSAKITVSLPKTQYQSLIVKGGTGIIELPKNLQFESADLKMSTGDVYCAATILKTLKITTSTGDIIVENDSVGAAELSVSTGDVRISSLNCQGDLSISVSTGKTILNDVQCKNLISSGSTGDMRLTNVIALEKFSIERSTGDVLFDGCDAGEIEIETSTGDVKGTLLSEKIVFANAATGKVLVPEWISGGKCKITTSTGDIILGLKTE